MAFLEGQRAVILGLARQGIALARYLTDRGIRITVSDSRSAADLQDNLAQVADLPITLALGGHPLSLLDDADLLLVSGGVPTDIPIVRHARQRDIPVSNDSQLFLDNCPARVIGITGSAGKTTTTALTGEILARYADAGGPRVWVGGNIGRSMLPDLDEIQQDDLVVMELSSFQLELMTRSVAVGAILNVTPNHLDRHKTMAAYTAAKANLVRFQQAGSVTLLGQDDPGAWALRPLVKGRLRSFARQGSVSDGAVVRGDMIQLQGPDGERSICKTSQLQLLGQHNVLNVLAAAVLADTVGVPGEIIAQAITQFSGVAHRLQLVRGVAGVRWYDDSIATAPERLMAALLAFEEPIILLAGGRDKDLPWEAAAAMIGQRTKGVVLFGEAADLIRGHLEAARGRVPGWQLARIEQVVALGAAVELAAGLASPGDIVLLSPGGTSFDAYVDFAARGEHFARLVNELEDGSA